MKPTKSSAMSRSVLTTIDLGIPNQAVSAEPRLALATWMTYLIFSSEEPIVARQVQGRRGSDIRFDMTISLEEAATGLEEVEIRRYACSTCGGSASPGSSMVCGQCQGTGQVGTTQSTPFGRFSTCPNLPRCRAKAR